MFRISSHQVMLSYIGNKVSCRSVFRISTVLLSSRDLKNKHA